MAKTPAERILCCKWISVTDFGRFDAGMKILFSSHDHEFIETVANRIIELTPNGIIDKMMEYDEYITSDHIKEMRARMYGDK